jgi:hypothetical protein
MLPCFLNFDSYGYEMDGLYATAPYSPASLGIRPFHQPPTLLVPANFRWVMRENSKIREIFHIFTKIC